MQLSRNRSTTSITLAATCTRNSDMHPTGEDNKNYTRFGEQLNFQKKNMKTPAESMNGGYASWRFCLASSWSSRRPCSKRIKINAASNSAKERTGVTAFPTVSPIRLRTLLAFFFGPFRVLKRLPILNRGRPGGTAPLASPGVSIYPCRSASSDIPRRLSRTTSSKPSGCFGNSG